MKSTFARPPFIGLLAFVIVFIVQALGHTVMIAMENIFGEAYVYQSAFALGALGAVLLFIGMKHPGEVAGTWYGFWAGTFLWTGWVEFAFVWNANYLAVPDLMDPRMPGQIATKAEYLVMMSSVGVLAATMSYFMLNKETKCNMFVWFQRNLGLRLFVYDENILGDHHPVTYGIFFVNTVWAIYLFQRLVQMWKVTTAIRYGIPTAIIAWNSVEIAGRWHLFTEFWEKPQEFGLEMGLVGAAIAVAAFLAVKTPAHQKAALQDQEVQV
jgi:hypothetical protein